MKLTYASEIDLKKVVLPEMTEPEKVFLSDETIEERRQKVLALMQKKDLDTVIIYADLEHGGNFEYLTGFVPRFEEAILVLHQNGKAYLLLGNENLNKAEKGRITAEAIHVPHFSLPNQPMENEQPLTNYFAAAEITKTSKVGLVGWKLFTAHLPNNQKLFDVPYYLVEAIKEIVGDNVVNATELFISSDSGARTTNNANEIAHYSFGAQLAGKAIFEANQKLDIGITEYEIGGILNQWGQRNSVVTIAAFGERFVKANLYPTNKKLQLSDRVAMTVGYKGGLSSRSGYAVSNAGELPEDQKDYLNAIAKPYFSAVVTWLENVKVGVAGQDIYAAIQTVLPQENYQWHLNPGHLVADEEWLASPIYPNSKETLQSGMLLQLDIIPSVAGFSGASCESTFCLANEMLQKELQENYPALWQQIETRRNYLKNELGIELTDDLLPLSDNVVLYSPFLLNQRHVLAKKKV